MSEMLDSYALAKLVILISRRLSRALVVRNRIARLWWLHYCGKACFIANRTMKPGHVIGYPDRSHTHPSPKSPYSPYSPYSLSLMNSALISAMQGRRYPLCHNVGLRSHTLPSPESPYSLSLMNSALISAMQGTRYPLCHNVGLRSHTLSSPKSPYSFPHEFRSNFSHARQALLITP